MLHKILNRADKTPWARPLQKALGAGFALLFAPRDWMFCKLRGLQWRSDWRFRGLPMVSRHWTAQIVIGRRFSAISRCRHNAIGVYQQVMLIACGRNSKIVIGDDVGMSGCTISAMQEVCIGNRVLIGSGVLITDNDGHPEAPEGRRYSADVPMKRVLIADDVFIGARAIILKGVVIGRGSIVGAGAVVTHDVPAMVIVAGNPACVIRLIRKSCPKNNR